MGQMSPDVGLFSAVRLPPARKIATSNGALPENSRLMTAWSGVCKGTSAASIKLHLETGGSSCCSQYLRLRSCGKVGMTGQALLGCLLMMNKNNSKKGPFYYSYFLKLRYDRYIIVHILE